jgi:hypothetical protein
LGGTALPIALHQLQLILSVVWVIPWRDSLTYNFEKKKEEEERDYGMGSPVFTNKNQALSVGI